MDWQSTPTVLLLLFAALSAAAWALYALRAFARGKRTQTVLAFVALCASAAVWAGMYAVQLAVPTLEAKLTAYKLLHVGAVFIGPAWFAFAVSYAGRGDLLTRRAVAAIIAVPTALLAALPTNPYSLALTDASLVTAGSLTLLVTGNGPLYQLHLAYSYVVIALGVGFIVAESLRSPPEVRRQAVLMIAGAVVPLGLNVLHVFSVDPFGALDAINVTPVSLALSTVLFGIAVFRYRLLDLTPMASKVVLAQISDGVVVLDRSDSIADVNPAAEALLGEREDVVGTDVSALLPAYDRLGRDDSVLTTVDADGSETFLQLNRSQLSRGGRRYGWVVLLRNVTELERKRRELERQNERLDAFASVVSHDLRNPLSVIDGYVGLARETGDPEHLDVIENTTARMNDFLEDLLRLSQRGETVTEPRALSLSELVAQVAREIDDEDLSVTATRDVTVTADRRRLAQVLDNLFRNARDHADGAVSVTVGPLSDGFYVEDDGPGLPESDRETVFDLGFTTRRDGTGLGLAIVRDIVEAHGWSIAATEGSAGGARFEVTGADVRLDRSVVDGTDPEG
ncbi:MAG: histidine kinase N-terminal 7TM domain-containing protein [Halorubrum sp.]